MQVFASVFKWFHRKFHYWLERRRNKNKENLDNPFQYIYQEEKVLLPSTACVSFLVIYIVIGDIQTESKKWRWHCDTLRHGNILSQWGLELSGLCLLLSHLTAQDRVWRLRPGFLQGWEPQHAALCRLLLPLDRDGDCGHELLFVSIFNCASIILIFVFSGWRKRSS